mmetsp:Transcript_36881/g.57676  ORF Transcript_36881/g.57676 Transcript_36881/m.57676 type:complete len:482 (+) Transcript_36881:37-1482(+)|eukprot:CAMPEP_0184316050 /NCGR_PEP_ID=MMETSP1049-20130417/87636_1 /TAXON_ID=77928 /ORGANISM="Proteomonas sulcata, Strain CCMP704" /LENGTH=481 /DNA_ID=CAMNT_0026634859 /DNA_START=36 /DNA_END=1481 /DNA_ORIENTATION=+
MSWWVVRYLRTQGCPGFLPIPLDDIDDEIMCRILDGVPAKFMLKNMMRVNKRMCAICNDDAIWESKIEDLPWKLEGDLVKAWKKNLGTSKLVYRMLIQIGWLNGYWILDDKPRGGLMRVQIREHDVVSSLMVPRLNGQDTMGVFPVTDFDTHTPFSFQVQRDGEVHVVTGGEELPAREFFGFTGSSQEDMKARTHFYTRGSSGSLFFKLIMRGVSKHSYLCHEKSALHTGEQQMAVTKRFPGHRNATVPDIPANKPPKGITSLRQAPDGSKIVQVPYLLNDPAFFEPRRLQGLWRGAYGPHGTELIAVNIFNLISSKFTELAGLKCTGDPNVPSGELAFRAPLNCDSGKMSACRHYSCECSFSCECPKPAYGESSSVVRRVYEGLALVAEHGFTRPTWNAGMVVVLDDGTEDMLLVWKGLFSVRFRRVAESVLDDCMLPKLASNECGCADNDCMDTECHLTQQISGLDVGCCGVNDGMCVE